MYWTWIEAVSKHGRRRMGRTRCALFHFRRREAVMGGMLLVVVLCVAGGTPMGLAVCRVLNLGGAT
jgi:hypothetical protein